MLLTCFVNFWFKLLFLLVSCLIQHSVTVLVFNSLLSEQSFFNSIKKNFSACPLDYTVCACLVGKLGRWESRTQTCLKDFFSSYLSQRRVTSSNTVCLIVTAGQSIIYCIVFKTCSRNRMINFLAGSSVLILVISLHASWICLKTFP